MPAYLFTYRTNRAYCTPRGCSATCPDLLKALHTCMHVQRRKHIPSQHIPVHRLINTYGMTYLFILCLGSTSPTSPTVYEIWFPNLIGPWGLDFGSLSIDHFLQLCLIFHWSQRDAIMLWSSPRSDHMRLFRYPYPIVGKQLHFGICRVGGKEVTLSTSISHGCLICGFWGWAAWAIRICTDHELDHDFSMETFPKLAVQI